MIFDLVSLPESQGADGVKESAISEVGSALSLLEASWDHAVQSNPETAKILGAATYSCLSRALVLVSPDAYPRLAAVVATVKESPAFVFSAASQEAVNPTARDLSTFDWAAAGLVRT